MDMDADCDQRKSSCKYKIVESIFVLSELRVSQ